MKKLAIGVDDFKLLIDQNSYFVDKSLFIEQIIGDGSQVMLFPRPRRFGKTLNMSMLNYFFNHNNAEENRGLFKGLSIEKSEVFEKYQGKFPVVFMSMKDVKSQNSNDFKKKIDLLLSELYHQHDYLLQDSQLTPLDSQNYLSVLEGKADQTSIDSALRNLSRLLARYHQQKVIILIDEYDTPVHEAYLHGFYEDVVGFMRIFLGNALKGNEHLQKGVLTGILRVSKESMFSDLNNVMIYSVLKEPYRNAFGFTQDEVDKLLEGYELTSHAEMVKTWYNGYYFGNEEVYNPWSILNFTAHKGRFEAYWLGTSANELVHKLIRESDNAVKKDIEDALNNVPVISRIDENIAFQYLTTARDNILSFFVQTGYLKARYKEMDGNRLMYEISIPNEELKIIYTDTIFMWFEKNIGSKNLNEMLKALISADIELFEEILNSFVISYLSFYQTSKDHIEKVYHAFVLGMLIQLQSSYHIESERESGYGRVDILMTPKDKSMRAIVIEMKKIRMNENKDTALESALKQIEDRQYETALRQQGCKNIMKIAVTFDGKRVWAKVG